MLSMAMEEGMLSEWLAPDGGAVEIGTVLYSIETDKSVQEIESPAAGTLKIIGKVGESYPVGELIGMIE